MVDSSKSTCCHLPAAVLTHLLPCASLSLSVAAAIPAASLARPRSWLTGRSSTATEGRARQKSVYKYSSRASMAGRLYMLRSKDQALVPQEELRTNLCANCWHRSCKMNRWAPKTACALPSCLTFTSMSNAGVPERATNNCVCPKKGNPSVGGSTQHGGSAIIATQCLDPGPKQLSRVPNNAGIATGPGCKSSSEASQRPNWQC
mmetsp:Transcript_26725/g.49047  ORF Transcript_26725/g.49047 Transcript_26725/m.49047 type:complete len:204 (-) Transcript_26725:1289-1900(-)